MPELVVNRRGAEQVPLATNPAVVANRRLAVLVVAGGVFLGIGCGEPVASSGNDRTSNPPMSGTARAQSSSDAPPLSASPAELAIVAPAVVGGKLADWAIVAIHGVDHGTLEIVCEKERARVVLSVALAADGSPEPPVSTERYAVFYSSRGATAADGERLAKALAELLQANRAVPPPPGLGPFVPRARSL